LCVLVSRGLLDSAICSKLYYIYLIAALTRVKVMRPIYSTSCEMEEWLSKELDKRRSSVCKRRNWAVEIVEANS
jgi:hypothetical protein